MSVQEAIKELRARMGLSQEGLARHMNLTLRTIARYENDAPPTGHALKRFRDLASQERHPDIAVVFFDALTREFGLGPAAPYAKVAKELKELGEQHGLRRAMDEFAVLMGRVNESEDLGEFYETAFNEATKKTLRPETDEEIFWIQMILVLIRNKDRISWKQIESQMLAALDELMMNDDARAEVVAELGDLRRQYLDEHPVHAQSVPIDDTPPKHKPREKKGARK
jgi:transcriptional regulator with XRE-family HTH domain